MRRRSSLAPEVTRRQRRGFCALRNVFETIGGEAKELPAVDAMMEHERGDMASVYREQISDERLLL